MLRSHPNQPLVQSVVKGLREGFWPLSEGERSDELQEVFDNYPSEASDLDAIRAFRDKECAAGRWVEVTDELVPGTKVSPLFVVWRDEKPRVVTDHSASGLNDEIPREEAKVIYDDMKSFGQCLHDAKQRYPH
jgi:hypothetical protein